MLRAALIVLATIVMSVSSNDPIFVYGQADSSKVFKTKSFPLYDREDVEAADAIEAAGNPRPPVNKTYYEVPQFNGNKNLAHQFARDTIKLFRVAARAGRWSEEKMFTNMYDGVLIGDGKDMWEEAINMGNGCVPISLNCHDSIMMSWMSMADAPAKKIGWGSMVCQMKADHFRIRTHVHSGRSVHGNRCARGESNSTCQ